MNGVMNEFALVRLCHFIKGLMHTSLGSSFVHKKGIIHRLPYRIFIRIYKIVHNIWHIIGTQILADISA